jgi:hypothetical protein
VAASSSVSAQTPDGQAERAEAGAAGARRRLIHGESGERPWAPGAADFQDGGAHGGDRIGPRHSRGGHDAGQRGHVSDASRGAAGAESAFVAACRRVILRDSMRPHRLSAHNLQRILAEARIVV